MLNQDSPVVVDIECFRFQNKEWIVKEIAVCSDYLDSLVFKPPYSSRLLSPSVGKSYKWITNNLHGISWDSGDYPYERLLTFIESVKLRFPSSNFYAKGLEKCEFLELLFERSFTDLDDLKCPKISDLPSLDITCSQRSLAHSESFHCARKKAQAYNIWLNHYLLQNGMHENQFIKEFNCLTINKRETQASDQ